MAAAQEWIVIRGMGSVSGLGGTRTEVLEAYAVQRKTFTKLSSLGAYTPVSPISASAEAALQAMLQAEPTYATLDRSVQLAILAARQAVAEAGWAAEHMETVGINLGSSRGATGLFEQYHAQFLANPLRRLSPASSPSTTLGNIASWVAYDLQAAGPQISHSVTCSTALQAFANGVAWLKAGLAKRFLVGGSEAPLTPFTVAQMKAIGIYSQLSAPDSPCRPFNKEGTNTFVLGEGAAVFALERMTAAELADLPQEKVVTVASVGLGYEQSPSKTGLSADGQHFQKAMRNALAQAFLSPEDVDAVVVHAPGTRAGDAAELAALETVFNGRLPAQYSNKTLLGHTLGASGGLSAELATLLLQERVIYTSLFSGTSYPTKYKNIIINAAGFGGNSASILLMLK